MTPIHDILTRHLADWQSGWSMGSFGALAEFHQDPGEPAEAGPLWRVTARGGLRLTLPPDLRALACETLSPRPGRWSQAVLLCLPAARLSRPRRSALTALGPDRDALRAADRGAELFDMGLGLAQGEFCIRTADPALLRILRAAEGKSLFAPGSPAMAAILDAHPHRVVTGPLGRAEVFQPIGGPATGGRSPEGPHTHVLPRLLASRRTHSANTPVPAGHVPCAALHPGNPVIGPLGEDRAFDAALFDAFQDLLARFGPEGVAALKRAVWDRIRDGADPCAMAAPAGRTARTALRLAVRQALRRDGPGPVLTRWSAAFDRGADLEEDDRPGHP